MNCQIEYVSSDSDVGELCGKPAVTSCADCGAAICSDWSLDCCGDSFCELCYDYHVHKFVLEKTGPKRAPSHSQAAVFGSLPDRAS